MGQKTISHQREKYRSGMKQNWTPSAIDGLKCYYDQFGFRIVRGRMYHLTRRGSYVTSTHSLQAAKEISLILLNDKIFHTPTE